MKEMMVKKARFVLLLLLVVLQDVIVANSDRSHYSLRSSGPAGVDNEKVYVPLQDVDDEPFTLQDAIAVSAEAQEDQRNSDSRELAALEDNDDENAVLSVMRATNKKNKKNDHHRSVAKVITTRSLKTYDCNYTYDPCALITNSSDKVNTSIAAVNDAHNHAINVYEFFKMWLGRDSMDDKGITIQSYVNVGDFADVAYGGEGRLAYGGVKGTLTGLREKV
jgi:Thermolysin metallopeptidase, catalytic domain